MYVGFGKVPTPSVFGASVGGFCAFPGRRSRKPAPSLHFSPYQRPKPLPLLHYSPVAHTPCQPYAVYTPQTRSTAASQTMLTPYTIGMPSRKPAPLLDFSQSPLHMGNSGILPARNRLFASLLAD